jgi:ankyrin repeat protein
MVLLSKMFDGDSIPDSHENPEFMCAAAACGSTDILEKLFQNGADPNADIEDCRARSCFKPEINCTALRWAIGYKQESAIRLLLESGLTRKDMVTLPVQTGLPYSPRRFSTPNQRSYGRS